MLIVGLGVLVLAMAGWAHPIPVLVWTAISAVATAAMTHSLWRRESSSRLVHWSSVAAVAVALLSVLWSSYAPSNHVLIDRDPGSYAATAKWISNHGSLRAPAEKEVFGSTDDLTFSSAAVYDVGTNLEFQFLDLPASVLAATDLAVGSIGFFRLSALVAGLGLLALYCVTTRVTRRPVLALVPVVAFAACAPFVSVARDIYSEPYAFALLWTGLLLLSKTRLRGSTWLAAITGGLMGATLLVRVDGLLNLLVLAAAIAIMSSSTDHLDQTPEAKRNRIVCGLTALAVAALAAIDLLIYSSGYATHLEQSLIQLTIAAGLAISLLVASDVAWNRLNGFDTAVRNHGKALGTIGASLVIVISIYGWIVRPKMGADHNADLGWGIIGQLQVAEGDKVDTFRSYAEHSLQWIQWYVGPFTVALAIAATALVAYRIFVKPPNSATLLVWGATIVPGLVYLWKPSITPDHIWAMRRFFPAVLPGLLVLATLAVAVLSNRASSSTARSAFISAGAALLIVPAVWASAPIALQRQQHGFDQIIEETCQLLGTDSAVIVVGEFDVAALPQTLRSWCGVPVASATPEQIADPAWVSDASQALRTTGRSLVVITSDESVAETIAGDAKRNQTSSILATNRPEHTITRAPSRYLDSDENFWVPAEYKLFLFET